MQIKKILKNALHFILHGVPVKKVYPQIVNLKQTELLKGRTALITGGTSGIGFEIAKAFINAGATVIITGRDEKRINTACSLIDDSVSQKGCVHGFVLDNTDVKDMKHKFEQICNLLPNRKLDILVNNAGILGCHISNGTEEDYDAVMDTNLKGVFFLSQIFGHYLKDNKIEGNILNIASSSSLRPAASAYTLSKWGIRGLTLGLAKSLAPYGIVVNGIAPGQTATPMLLQGRDSEDFYAKSTPIHRYILPCEIANMAVVLTSDMGRSIMGDIVYMTGGAGVFSNEDMNYRF